MNLFTIKNRFAIHLATNSVIIALSESWFKSECYVKCAVPQSDDNGKTVYLAHATYNLNELKIL